MNVQVISSLTRLAADLRMPVVMRKFGVPRSSLRILIAIPAAFLVSMASSQEGPCEVQIEADEVRDFGLGHEYRGSVQVLACSSVISAPFVRAVTSNEATTTLQFIGGVRLIQRTGEEPIIGRSDSAIYDLATTRIRFTGRPRLSQGRASQYGAAMTLHLRDYALVSARFNDRLRVVPERGRRH